MDKGNVNSQEKDPSNVELKNSPSENFEKADSKEVKETSDKFAASVENVDGVDALDGMESVDGRVSEVLKDASENKGASMKSGGATQQYTDPAQIRANLLKNIPSESAMKRQIEGEIEKEIRYLRRKAIKMMTAPSQISYFEMSNLAKKIRELKGVLISLAKASIESLKTLWLRYVHGIV